MPTPRIVITGLGCVTPLGHDIETVWKALLNGDAGARPIEHFDAATFPTTFASQVLGYDWRPLVNDPALHEGIGHNTGFALGAATQAWKHAGLDQYAELDHDRLGIYLGSGEGSLDLDAYVASNLAGWSDNDSKVLGKPWAEYATQHMTPIREFEQEPNMPLAHLALEFDARGPASNCLTACAASTQAIGEASYLLQRGDADVMITGGAHTMIHPMGVTGFNRLTALSNRNDDITTASRPFSVDRDGFVMGEGGGILILETLDHATQRGATPLAEVTGYGSTADAYRITDIHPDGRGAAAAMRQALDHAGITPADIDYISAHGTGTKENDSIETRAIKAVFAPEENVAAAPPVSSIKSMLGHLIAAAGAVEAIACVLAIRDQALPPTINLHRPDPECDLDYIPNTARHATADQPITHCLSNSFGFGGQNDTLVIQAIG
ncbi:MAG: beta-ketoacyl-[acyl-carrier-protein] synthase family protein [Planctomycetota bacterium]